MWRLELGGKLQVISGLVGLGCTILFWVAVAVIACLDYRSKTR